jgi:hypothetical protein
MSEMGVYSRWWLRLLAVFVALFGVATIKAGGSVLFGGGEARLAAGAYLPFVVWFNFIAGFFYIIGGIGLFQRKAWGAWVSASLAVGTLLTFAFFLNHVVSGGAYETRTLAALSLRSTVWIVATVTAWRLILRHERQSAGLAS